MKLRERWNADADSYNQWSELGLDEKEEFAETVISEKEYKIKILTHALRAMLEVCDEPCRLDHHGLCQEHNCRRNGAGEPECQVVLAREALGEGGVRE